MIRSSKLKGQNITIVTKNLTLHDCDTRVENTFKITTQEIIDIEKCTINCDSVVKNSVISNDETDKRPGLRLASKKIKFNDNKFNADLIIDDLIVKKKNTMTPEYINYKCRFTSTNSNYNGALIFNAPSLFKIDIDNSNFFHFGVPKFTKESSLPRHNRFPLQRKCYPIFTRPGFSNKCKSKYLKNKFENKNDYKSHVQITGKDALALYSLLRDLKEHAASGIFFSIAERCKPWRSGNTMSKFYNCICDSGLSFCKPLILYMLAMGCIVYFIIGLDQANSSTKMHLILLNLINPFAFLKIGSYCKIKAHFIWWKSLLMFLAALVQGLSMFLFAIAVRWQCRKE